MEANFKMKKYTESDFVMIENIAASQGCKIFDGGRLQSIWLAMPAERRVKTQRTADAVARKARWQCASADDIRAEARRKFDNDAEGQMTLAGWTIQVAGVAAEAGCAAAAEVIMDAEAAIAAEQAAELVRAAAEAERQASEAARIAGLRAEIDAAIAAIKGRYAPEDIPSPESVGREIIATNKSALDCAIRIAEIHKSQHISTGADDCGYAHGQDFEGGQW